jgi:hypothetical protein
LFHYHFSFVSVRERELETKGDIGVLVVGFPAGGVASVLSAEEVNRRSQSVGQ